MEYETVVPRNTKYIFKPTVSESELKNFVKVTFYRWDYYEYFDVLHLDRSSPI